MGGSTTAEHSLVYRAKRSRRTTCSRTRTRPEYIEATVAKIAAATDADKGEVIRLLLSVDASYLGAAFEQVEHHYGTVENYLTAGLELAPELVGALETRLVS